MTRIVTFSDSYASATEPSIEVSNQEDYEILNGASDEVLLTINSESYKSAFFSFELIRKDDSNVFIETGKMQLIFIDGAWNFAKNISIGSEMIVSTIESPEHLVFSVQTTMGVGELKYNSGTMGSGYEGTFRISMVRIAAI